MPERSETGVLNEKRDGRPGLHRVVVGCASGLIILAAAWGQARAEEPRMTSSVGRVLLPLPTVETLDAGQVESDPARGIWAIQIDVEGGTPLRGWVLYLRAEQSTFTPGGAGKRCTDLRWKLDQEGAESYRRLDDHEAIVLENPVGGNARITLDVSVDLGWQTDPGTYGLGLVLRLASQ
jgi:hypothetical protein